MEINKEIYIEVLKEELKNKIDENLLLQSILIEKNQYISLLEEEVGKLNKIEKEKEHEVKIEEDKNNNKNE